MATRVAIVTGGAGMLGRGVCQALSKAGYKVACLDIATGAAEGADLVIPTDVTDPMACKDAVDRVLAQWGGVDALVNMAQKIVIQTPLLELDEEQMTVSFASGPMAALRMMQLCHPSMKARGGGAIVNFASEAGTRGVQGMGAYASAKEAIRGLTKIACIEWGPDNIRVNTLCPLAFGAESAGSAWADSAAQRSPLKRAGDPEADIGEAVVYLVGQRFITGRTIHVDGGTGGFR